VLTSDVCTVVVGVVMYLYLSGISEYVQAPTTTGYGFSAPVIVAGLCLVPFSVATFAASRALPWLNTHFGQRALLPVGSLVVSAAGAFFALAIRKQSPVSAAVTSESGEAVAVS